MSVAKITLKSYEAWSSVGSCPISRSLPSYSKLRNELSVLVQHRYKVLSGRVSHFTLNLTLYRDLVLIGPDKVSGQEEMTFKLNPRYLIAMRRVRSY